MAPPSDATGVYNMGLGCRSLTTPDQTPDRYILINLGAKLDFKSRIRNQYRTK